MAGQSILIVLTYDLTSCNFVSNSALRYKVLINKKSIRDEASTWQIDCFVLPKLCLIKCWDQCANVISIFDPMFGQTGSFVTKNYASENTKYIFLACLIVSHFFYNIRTLLSLNSDVTKTTDVIHHPTAGDRLPHRIRTVGL